MKKLLLASLVAGLACVHGLASADTKSATFDVKLKVLKSCAVTAGSGSNIVFNDVQAGAAAPGEQSSSISVLCSNTTPYSVGLLPSNNSTSGAGAMKAGGAASIAYQLRKTAGGLAWGNSGTDVVSNTGSGVAQTIPVFAAVTGSTNVAPGDYTDTVTVTVTY